MAVLFHWHQRFMFDRQSQVREKELYAKVGSSEVWITTTTTTMGKRERVMVGEVRGLR